MTWSTPTRARVLSMAVTCALLVFSDAADAVVRSFRQSNEESLGTDFYPCFRAKRAADSLLVVKNENMYCQSM